MTSQKKNGELCGQIEKTKTLIREVEWDEAKKLEYSESPTQEDVDKDMVGDDVQKWTKKNEKQKSTNDHMPKIIHQSKRTSKNRIINEKPKVAEKEKKLKLKGGTSMNTTRMQKSEGTRRNGLKNLGNTCYLNALLQCIARCKRVQTVLNNSKNDEMEENRIATLFRDEFKQITTPERDEPHSPEILYEEVMKWEKCKEWVKGEQQDAGELLTILINKLQKEKIEIAKLFVGDQTSLKTCKQCGKSTWNDDTYITLALDMDEEDSNIMGRQEEERMVSPKTIEDLLEKYKKKEHLEKTNEVYCTECGDKQCAEKNLEILEGAAILALQLKRYKEGHIKENGAKTTAEKVEKHIAFSRELKLKRIPSWGIKDTVQHYKLRGVIEHTGKTTKDGHYLAYVREGNAWTKWDDDTSSIIPWKKVQTKQAYILIWEKTEEKPILDVNESDKEMELDMKNKKRKRAEHRNLMQEKGTRKEVGHAEKRKKIAVITRNNEEEENQMKRRQRSTENEDPATRRTEE